MDGCKVGADAFGSSFEEVLAAMQTDKYWINFFVRPCCPPPGASDAVKSLDRRREEIRCRSDFSDEEKKMLLDIVDKRQQWYMSSPFCKGR